MASLAYLHILQLPEGPSCSSAIRVVQSTLNSCLSCKLSKISLQDSCVGVSAYVHTMISLNLKKLLGIYFSMDSYMGICGITKYLDKLALLFHPFYFWQSFISSEYVNRQLGSIVKGHLSFPIAALVSVVSALLTFNHRSIGKERMETSWKLVGKWKEKQVHMYGLGDHSDPGDWTRSETWRRADQECKK